MQSLLLPSYRAAINPFLEQEMCFKHKEKVKLNNSVLHLVYAEEVQENSHVNP